MANDEPEYLKALRRNQQRNRKPPRGRPAAEPRDPLSPAEREALRWAREVAGQDVRAAPTLRGAKCAFLSQPRSYDPKSPVLLDGVGSREALLTRYEAATSFGDKVLGCYDLISGRPLSIETVEGKVTFVPGQARQIARPLTPEQMIRKAAQEAEQKARTRRPDEGRRGRGPGGGRR